MDIKQTFRYNISGSSVDDDIQVSLEISHFQKEIHFAVVADTLDLISYEVFELPVLFSSTDFQNLLYKWISTNGYIPAKIRLTNAKEGFYLLPAALKWTPAIEQSVFLKSIESDDKAASIQMGSKYQVVFIPDNRVLTSLQLIFTEVENSHYLPSVVGYFEREVMGQGTHCCMYVMPGKVCIMIISPQGILSAFEKVYATREDVLYYVLAAYKNYNLDPSTTPLMAGGYIVASAPILTLLEGYIQAVQFVSIRSEHFPVSIPDLYDGTLMPN